MRIYLPQTQHALELPPNVELRHGSAQGTLRINDNRFWWQVVRAGFRLGRSHDTAKIRQTLPPARVPEFEQGYAAASA
ncbi:MAG TPA: hypothetical protein VG206_12685 [Terriglobia bacterium]|nr:hypothetical protein [Terriglobia bacterium]